MAATGCDRVRGKQSTKGSLENHHTTHRHGMDMGVERMDTGHQTLIYDQESGHFIKGIGLHYSELVCFPYISSGKDLHSGSFNLDWILRNHHKGVFGKSPHNPNYRLCCRDLSAPKFLVLICV